MIDFILEIYTYQAEGVNYAAIGPLAMMAIGGGIKALASYDWGGKRRKAANRAQEAYDAQKDIYQQLDTSNVFTNMQNPYQNLENVFEDVQVNTQQADFERNMFRQQQADTLNRLRGAAGASGIAGLAQVMANQQQTQAQRISASIGQQEARGRLMAAQQAAKLQQLEAGQEAKNIELARRGELISQQMEQSKQATLLGMESQGFASAKQAQMQGQQMFAQGIGSMVGAYAGMGSGGWNWNM